MVANILTIAGTDPSGGAGISADLKTFSALGAYGMHAITCVVAQNTQGVRQFQTLSTDFIAEQIACVFEDVQVDAVKIGMVATAEIAETVAKALKQYCKVPVVLDPVMVAKSGDVLLQPDAIDAIRSQLVPLATVMTPNIYEAAVLLQCDAPKDLVGMQQMLPDLANLGAHNIVLKGGNLKTDESVDYLYDGKQIKTLVAPRIATQNLHGTGCTLSAAIATFLTRYSIEESVKMAKVYLTQALKASYQLNVGRGHGPVHHFQHLWPIDDSKFQCE